MANGQTAIPLAKRASSARRRPGSVTIYLALMAYLALVKIIITFVPATFRSISQAAVFAWPFIGIWTVAGLIGIWFARKTGFPEAWDARVSTVQQLLIPALLGIGLSLPFIATDMLTHYNSLLAAQYNQPRANIDFPASLLIYPGGAIIVEVFYRLLPVPLLLWLISNVMLRGRGQSHIFWILAILTSLIEPLTQDLDVLPFGMTLFAVVFLEDFALNLAQAALFRKCGFLAAIVMRVAFYMIWHVLYVH